MCLTDCQLYNITIKGTLVGGPIYGVFELHSYYLIIKCVYSHLSIQYIICNPQKLKLIPSHLNYDLLLEEKIYLKARHCNIC